MELTPESRSLKQGISLSFINNNDEFSSLEGNCVDFEKYKSSLVQMGFVDSPVYGKLVNCKVGGLPSTQKTAAAKIS